MLLLTSNGLSSPALRDALRPRLSGCRSACLVTTASVGYKANDRHLPRLMDELRDMGLTSFSLFDFDEQPAQELLQSDVVEIIGGNPFYLLRAMKRAQCEDVLRRLSRERMLIGVSAGALVLQRSIALAAQYTPEMNEGIGLTDLSGFALTDVEILPHYSRFVQRFDRFEERAQAYERVHGVRVLRLDDGQAYIAIP